MSRRRSSTLIGLCTLTAASGSALATGPQSVTDAPPLHLDQVAVDTVPVGERVLVDGLIQSDGRAVRLDVTRFQILTPDARMVQVGRQGEVPLAAPPLVLLRGTIDGDASARVFLGVSPDGVHGFIRKLGGVEVISSGRYDPAAAARTVKVQDAATLTGDPTVPGCGVDHGDPWFTPVPLPLPVDDGGVAGIEPQPPCRVARLAIDTDWEFTANLFGGNTAASAAYALTLIAGVGEIYQADVNSRLLVSYLRVWDADVDPYDPGAGDLLDQFRNLWNDTPGTEDRELAHLLSGRQDLPYGGVAYVAVMCNQTYGYGVSGHLNGTFPYPLQDNAGGNWDLVVVAHELGHNFGTSHTHNYNPPLDNCGNGDCTGADAGTIMSYCHTCPGGIANIRLGFREEVIGYILGYLGAIECDITASGANSADDVAATYTGAPVVIDVLLNDLAASCEITELALGEFDAVTEAGGTVELVPAGGEVDRDRLQYTPPVAYAGQDIFTYGLSDASTATVTVSVAALRAPDATGITEPGAAVSYYQLQSPSVLPDFDALTPISGDVVPQVDFPSTDGNFVTSGLADEVGAVFTGFINVVEDGLYRFYIDSDDGSALFIGDELVVDNDGLHGMVERSGSIALQAGPHAIAIEFFENGGGAGLIASVSGPKLDKQPIPASAWSHGVPCPADVNGDAVIDVQDLVEVINTWGTCDAPCPGDLNGDGTVDVQDLIAVVSGWGPC